MRKDGEAVLNDDDSSVYKIGDVPYGAPYHICPTAARYERAIVVENNEPAGKCRVIARER